ncbi:symmetrical bis(5'-nucleosyl)-tetraphosphatase [Arhodomonas aquaeolei]|uniref:symmetrical bis(5'-nucleosyl)-tetraphosphatase n=1 Tax=Arhodomonas TaxID=2368 RepID=UPI00035D9088|nr:symmetrical bis(5'-nucleosyl)-tetraphosphatase [Arhodomonas aquaeolei]MCS4502942.1 symmetrical bis(5'-nucleosyl)-tetraphosphatase [Arhodomonas aquaeolei]
MAVYAIGDIQGCYDALQRLLERIRFDPAADRLWFTGDLVNRGPQSLQTLRLVRGLGSSAVTVLGNHDIHLLGIAAGFARAKRTDTVTEIIEAEDGEELLEWLRRCPLLHESAEFPGRVLVHAGLSPAWSLEEARAAAREVEAVLGGDDHRAFLRHLYGNRPDRWDPALEGWERLRYITNALTRMRFCSTDGRLLLDYKGSPAQAPRGYYPWFRVPHRALDKGGLQVVFGHWSTLGLISDARVLSLDTGCLWGGSLTAARLDDGDAITAVACEAALQPGPGR